MKIASFIRLTITAAILCLASSAANAATSALTLHLVAPNVWTGTYSDAFVSGKFFDVFTFSNPAQPTLTASGGVNAIGLGIGASNVILDMFRLVDANTSQVLASGITGGTSSFLSFTLPNAVDIYNLQVSGHTDPLSGMGLYSGNIAVTAISAVPEPQTYAMLLAGLGLIGITALRRKKSTLAFA